MKKTQNKSSAKPVQHKKSGKLDLLPTIIFVSVLAVGAIVTPTVFYFHASSPTSQTFSFTFTGTRCLIDGHEKYTEQIEKDKTNVEFTISSVDSPVEAFIMPKTVEGLPEGISYSKTAKNTAKITIEKMDKDYTVDMSAVTEKVRFRLKIENCLIDGNDEGIFVHYDRYTKPEESWTIAPKAGYELPEYVAPIPECLSYVKSGENATVSFIDEIEDPTVITVRGISPTTNYDFSFSGDHYTLDNEETYPAGAKPKLTLVANTGYTLPDSITVTMGGSELVVGDDYIYVPNYPETGKAALSFLKAISGDVVVTVVAP